MTPIFEAALAVNEEVVLGLIDKVNTEEAIEALELLGANIIDRNRDFNRARVIWTRALTMRLTLNAPFANSGSCDYMEAYQNAREVTSHEELSELFANPDAVRMQALLLRERILGQAHPDTTRFIVHRGSLLSFSGRLDECLKLWRRALDILLNIQQPLNSASLGPNLRLCDILILFVEVLAQLIDRSTMEADCEERIAKFPAYEDLMYVMDKAIQEVKSATVNGYDKEKPIEYQRILRITIHLACLLSNVLPQRSQKEQFEARKKLFELVSTNPVDSRGYSIMHIACSRGSNIVRYYKSCLFPSVPLIKLLCELGTPASAVDNRRNTPLHLAALSGKYVARIAPFLMENGAHLDQPNEDGDTFDTLLSKVFEKDAYKYLSGKLKRGRISLTCLCARVVQAYSIPYDTVPTIVKEIIEIHGTEEHTSSAP